MERVLVVDDQLGMRMLLEQVLLEGGYRGVSAASGKEALDKCLEFKPQCIIFDMRMPKMNGFEFVAELKNLKYSAFLIMMTAYCDQNIIDQARVLGINHHILKPFNIEELLELLNKLSKELQVS